MSGDVVRPHFSSFRRRFSARQTVVGSFIKTPTTHATEIFGALGYDFVVIDEEHAPIDRAMTDTMLLAARASNLAGIVRVASDDSAKILSCLDCGATGVLVPHVSTVEKARRGRRRRTLPRWTARLFRVGPRRRLWRHAGVEPGR